MKKIKVNIFDRSCKYMKTLEFNTFSLALAEMTSGNWHNCELADDKKINYTYNNKELKIVN